MMKFQLSVNALQTSSSVKEIWVLNVFQITSVGSMDDSSLGI